MFIKEKGRDVRDTVALVLVFLSIFILLIGFTGCNPIVMQEVSHEAVVAEQAIERDLAGLPQDPVPQPGTKS